MSGPGRVLVADDNRVDRMVLAAIVRREGYDVAEAVDGHDALRKFREFAPQMVLLDALMPGLDGFEVARQVKAAAGEELIPIIFLTSLTEADALARAVEAGGDDFLSKPYNQIVLKAKLNALQRMRTMHATMQRQRDEISRHHAHLVQEQEAAKAVFDNVAHTGHLDAPFIRYLISPLAIFNGDVLLAARSPADDLFVLLGDFTGHGLTAAVGAMPLAEIFYGMTEKGFAPGEILREANRKLLAIMPKGYFCCAMLVALKFRKQELEFWNGGLPHGSLIRNGGAVTQLESRHLPLGVLSDERFDPVTHVLPMTPGERLVLSTDGIVDARDAFGTPFGHERVDRIVAGLSPGMSAFEAIQRAVQNHIGGGGRDDDITLVEITMVTPVAAQLPPLPARTRAGDGGEDWCLTYELGPSSLRTGNPLPLLQQVLVEFPDLRRHAGTIHTVLGELYSNALEHGLLGLDSSAKSSPSGFTEYYRARARALDSLQGFVRFRFRCRIDEAEVCLSIAVTDSGPGFDYRAVAGGDERAYHGRGLKLLRSLCSEVRLQGRGNQVEVMLRWSHAHV
jgi:two-component system, HptB-dependent secretion and biofilm response regulator